MSFAIILLASNSNEKTGYAQQQRAQALQLNINATSVYDTGQPNSFLTSNRSFIFSL